MVTGIHLHIIMRKLLGEWRERGHWLLWRFVVIVLVWRFSVVEILR